MLMSLEKYLGMWNRDNINIEINLGNNRLDGAKWKAYTGWLKDRNIKYSEVREPSWSMNATALNMRNEDALLFKLTFGL